MSAQMDALVAEVTNTRGVEASAKVAILGEIAQLEQMRMDLTTAIATATDLTAAAAAADALVADQVTQMRAASDDLASAIPATPTP